MEYICARKQTWDVTTDVRRWIRQKYTYTHTYVHGTHTRIRTYAYAHIHPVTNIDMTKPSYEEMKQSAPFFSDSIILIKMIYFR